MLKSFFFHYFQRANGTKTNKDLNASSSSSSSKNQKPSKHNQKQNSSLSTPATASSSKTSSRSTSNNSSVYNNNNSTSKNNNSENNTRSAGESSRNTSNSTNSNNSGSNGAGSISKTTAVKRSSPVSSTHSARTFQYESFHVFDWDEYLEVCVFSLSLFEYFLFKFSSYSNDFFSRFYRKQTAKLAHPNALSKPSIRRPTSSKLA